MSSEKENSKSDDTEEVEKDPRDESTGDSKDDTDDKSAEESEDKEKEAPKRKQTKVKESKKEKEVKSEEEEEEDEDEDEEEGDKDDKVPLLDQPLELSGSRERKKVQRFTEEFKSEPKDVAVIEIPEGKGTALGSIPRIEANISKFRPDVLKPLHKVLFGRVGKSTLIKKNIRKFNGFDFEKSSDQFEKRKHVLQKLEMRVLRMLCSILDVEKKGNREELAEKLATFLLQPKDSGKPAPTPRPRRTSAKTNSKSYSESDGENEKRPSRSKRGKGKRKSLKEDSSGDEGGKEDEEDDHDEKDEESEADEEDVSSDEDAPKSKKRKKSASKGPKTNAKKTPAKKSNTKKTPSKKPEKKPVSKKRKAASENDDSSSEDDEPLAKKTKAPPTDEEIKTYVKEILEGANLEEITMKTVCKQVYAHYPEFDLAHKKDFIKVTVKSLIST